MEVLVAKWNLKRDQCIRSRWNANYIPHMKHLPAQSISIYVPSGMNELQLELVAVTS